MGSRAWDLNAHLTERLPTHWGAPQQALSIKGVPPWAEMPGLGTPATFSHWLGLPKKNMAFKIWRLSTNFTRCNSLASSFLKGDLSGTPPGLPHRPTVFLFLLSLIRKVTLSSLERNGQGSREKLAVLLPCVSFSRDEEETQKEIPVKERSFTQTRDVRNNSLCFLQPIPCHPTCLLKRSC